MRHDHKELIRLEMSNSDKYSHDICSLSISDICSLITYNYSCIEKSKCSIDNAINARYNRTIVELEAYLLEFNERLSNRTTNFKAE